MSSYTSNYKNKETGEIIEIFAIDDYFGAHKYGYKFPDGKVMREKEFYEKFTRQPPKEEATPCSLCHEKEWEFNGMICPRCGKEG